MKIDIRHIAKLSKLSIPEDQIEKFEAEMYAMLQLVEHLPEIEGKATAVDTENTMELREDVVIPSASREDMLMNAPQTAAGCIVMPKVVE
ncbi:MAG: Asp-tRNA(Asn)/Glu-tRNA(Gln) amidotransferase subunit GatC [Ruminococcaceae bacterium]|nr:Asp-tRNA(Asn)/Glu-tRNA(Gln) amidotransferase subunit GatC [Oscillospiraceae bacterium]